MVNNLVKFFNKINGLERLVNSPIEGVLIPSTGEDTVIRSTDEFPFSTVGDFISQLENAGHESYLDPINSVDLQNGIVTFNTRIGENG